MKKYKEIIMYGVIILSVILIRTFIAAPVIVNGSSMQPTLFNKEVLLLTKNKKGLQRFDIIVLEINGEHLVKRVIGLPFDHLKYKNNQLYINNNIVDESYLEATTFDFDIRQMGLEVIPDNHYFVLGDNRGSSRDSRFFGVVNIDNIIGKIKYRIYPLNKIGQIR